VEDALGLLWRNEADAAAVIGGLREATNETRHEDAGEVLADLRTDYARLFTGPGLTALAGFESQWAGGRGDPSAPVFGPVASAVEKTYAEEGVRASAGLPADRASTEAEFLYLLSAREASAWRDCEGGEARRLRALREQFIVVHAGAWLPLLADDLGTAAHRGFYAGLATLLGSFIRAELAAVGRPQGERRRERTV
jgi:TorA maturation chaperone TorD